MTINLYGIANSLAYSSAYGDLYCEQKTGNSHDLQAMAIKKTIDGNLQVVGCVPRKISRIYSIILRTSGSITLM